MFKYERSSNSVVPHKGNSTVYRRHSKPVRKRFDTALGSDNQIVDPYKRLGGSGNTNILASEQDNYGLELRYYSRHTNRFQQVSSNPTFQKCYNQVQYKFGFNPLSNLKIHTNNDKNQILGDK